MPATGSNRIDRVVVRMYRLGTGDCFVLKFMKGNTVSFKMLIDCGCWTRKSEEIRPFLEVLKKDVDNEVDVLVVTHEHTDHVLGFQAGKQLFTKGFKAKRIWMAWTERDGDPEVEEWRKDHGEKKRALGVAARELSRRVATESFEKQFLAEHGGHQMLSLRQNYAAVLADFAALHVDGEAKPGLAGMTVVKNEIAAENRANVEYFEPGQVIENRPGLEGVRIFVLGPPKVYEQIARESGGAGESYQHNKDLEESDFFARAVNALDIAVPRSRLEPFAADESEDDAAAGTPGARCAKSKQRYDDPSASWRRIDDDWLFSAGQLALRMNSLTNNLSLVLAFEFVDSGKVVLFPGDAEYGSWQSWHQIDWTARFPDLTTEKLLERVVFYKVAHHLSHNGTAQRLGLEMMNSPDLAAMATLDYDVISSGWTSTMPNRQLVKSLLERTKGRLMIMNPAPLFFDPDDRTPLPHKIDEYRRRMTPEEKAAFDAAYAEDEKYLEYVVAVA